MTEQQREAGRCDFCLKSLTIGEVIYTYFTPSTGTYEQSLAGEAFWAEDPEWAACLDCHSTIVVLDEGRVSVEDWVVFMAKRSLRNQQMLVVGPPDMKETVWESQLKHVVDTLKAFALNKTPDFREEVNAGV